MTDRSLPEQLVGGSIAFGDGEQWLVTGATMHAPPAPALWPLQSDPPVRVELDRMTVSMVRVPDARFAQISDPSSEPSSVSVKEDSGCKSEAPPEGVDPFAVAAHGIARKRPVDVTFRRAEVEGTIATTEGEMRYRAGDYILTDASGDGRSWPVDPDYFRRHYDIVSFAVAGSRIPQLGHVDPADDDRLTLGERLELVRARLSDAEDELRALARVLDPTGESFDGPTIGSTQAYQLRAAANLAEGALRATHP